MKPSTPIELAQSTSQQYAAVPVVEAVALAGSQVSGLPGLAGDIDLYVYSHTPVSLADRTQIATKHAARAEVDNQFWENGDEWIDGATGIHVDVMMRSTSWITAQLERVLVRHEASTGYSTCFWYNVLASHSLFDRNGWFGELQQFANQPYPEELRQAILAKNHPILSRSLSSLIYQLRSAAARGDLVSLNHRTTALLASYFDILFAVNGLPHPGEKRLVEYCEKHCEKLPQGMRDDISNLLNTLPDDGEVVVERALKLIDGLDILLIREGLIPVS